MALRERARPRRREAVDVVDIVAVRIHLATDGSDNTNERAHLASEGDMP